MSLDSVTSATSVIKKIAHYDQRSNTSMEDAVKFSIANSSSSKKNNLIFKRSVPIKFNARPDKSMDALIIKAEKESDLGIFTAERMVVFL